jgi:hypothetical protein
MVSTVLAAISFWIMFRRKVEEGEPEVVVMEAPARSRQTFCSAT